LGAVDLSSQELNKLRRLRILVAEVNAHTVESEAYAMSADPSKQENLQRILNLFREGRLEIRSAPLGGWSPDFTVFSNQHGPNRLLLGLHWFHRPFPHRGPAWVINLGSEEAEMASKRFTDIWENAHDIGPAVRRLMERTAQRGTFRNSGLTIHQ
jgi:hypothetical protein